MPQIDKIVTRGGDKGQTSLVDGTRVPKGSQRVRTYGAVDELNSVFGLALCEELPDSLAGRITQLQNELFNLGGELATPVDSEFANRLPRIQQSQIDRLENWIDETNSILKPAEGFILPGGNRAAATLHLARTVTRRCERELATLMETDQINPLCLSYLNRLSDLCFVWARRCNNKGEADILWRSGPA